MAKLERKRLDNADETVPFEDKGQVELVGIGGGVVGPSTFEPGWKWSELVKPIVGTESCEAAHFGYQGCYRRSRLHSDRRVERFGSKHAGFTAESRLGGSK